MAEPLSLPPVPAPPKGERLKDKVVLLTGAAQGIGAGLLTARLGIKAMEVCRPLPWIDGDKPRLGDFRRELIGQLKETLNKKPAP